VKQPSTHILKLNIGNSTLTFEEYAAIPTREERMARRQAFIQILTDNNRELDRLERQITADVRAQFKAELDSIPRTVPGPTRRHKPRPNPVWQAAARRQEETIQRLIGELVDPTYSRTFRWPYEFDDVISKWEAAVQTPMEELKSRLGSHDWYFHYSDDHGVFMAGQRAHDTIQALVRQLGAEGQLMYNRACPWLNEDGTPKKDAA
jgi:hypothetical protein